MLSTETLKRLIGMLSFAQHDNTREIQDVFNSLFSVLLLLHHLNQAGDGLEQGAVLINRDLAACDRLRAAHRLEGVNMLLAIEGNRAGAGERLGLDLLKVCGSDLLRERGDVRGIERTGGLRAGVVSSGK